MKKSTKEKKRQTSQQAMLPVRPLPRILEGSKSLEDPRVTRSHKHPSAKHLGLQHEGAAVSRKESSPLPTGLREPFSEHFF